MRLLLPAPRSLLPLCYQVVARRLLSTTARRSGPLRRSACTRRSTLRRSAGSGAHAITRRSPLRRSSSPRRALGKRGGGHGLFGVLPAPPRGGGGRGGGASRAGGH